MLQRNSCIFNRSYRIQCAFQMSLTGGNLLQLDRILLLKCKIELAVTGWKHILTEVVTFSESS